MQRLRLQRAIRAASLSGLLVIPLHVTQAQGTIRGIVRDSLRTGAAIADAAVELVGSTSPTVTDSLGRFEFRDVAPGHHTLMYSGKRLDSLGLESVMTEVDVQSGKVVDAQLATPSELTYKLAICGSSFHSDYAVLRGRATSSAQTGIAAAKLLVLWSETLMMPGMNEDRDRTMEAKTNRNGDFVFCGVPRGIDVILMLPGATGQDTARLRLQLNEPVNVQDVRYAPSDPTVMVTGRVVSPGGAAVPNAVAANLVTGLAYARADSAGRFQFSIPRVSLQLVFRGVGFTPASRELELVDHDIDLGNVEIGSAPNLARVLVNERREMSAEEMGFEGRRKKGVGAFLDEEILHRTPMVSAQFVSGRQTIAHVESGEHGTMLLKMFGGGRSCDPLFFLNGLNIGRLNGADQNDYLKKARRIEIYRDATAPRQFSDSDHCGAVVIWTR